MYPTEPPRPLFTLITCEHGGNEVPSAYKHLFRDQRAVLETHRGYDIGALAVALHITPRLAAPILFSTITRLLVDLNRSAHHPELFSEFTAPLPADERDHILAAFYTPHRDAVARTVSAAITAGHRVLHVGVHSCTDVLHGERRDLDLSILFDDARPFEAEFAERVRSGLIQQRGDLRYPLNEPYKGADDGLTTTLRQRFDPDRYLGIEIEVRQGIIRERAGQRAAGDLLGDALIAACARS